MDYALTYSYTAKSLPGRRRILYAGARGIRVVSIVIVIVLAASFCTASVLTPSSPTDLAVTSLRTRGLHSLQTRRRILTNCAIKMEAEEDRPEMPRSGRTVHLVREG